MKQKCEFCGKPIEIISTRFPKYCQHCIYRSIQWLRIEHWIIRKNKTIEEGKRIISTRQQKLSKRKRNKTSYPVNHEYWERRFNVDLETAKIMVKDWRRRNSEIKSLALRKNQDKYRTWLSNRHNKKLYIKKYGEELGLKKFNEIEEKRRKNSSTSLNYWINKGFSLEEAKLKLKERQTTFTLKKCIAKYGKDVGTKRFNDRQKKWQQTLNNKPLEEKQRINRAKANWDAKKSGIVSKMELRLANMLGLDINTHCQKMLSCDKWGTNIYDIVVGNKIIEFNGNFWHCNPAIFSPDYFHPIIKQSAAAIWKRDEIKNHYAESKGYKVLVIWESEFKTSPQSVVLKCKQFLELNPDDYTKQNIE